MMQHYKFVCWCPWAWAALALFEYSEYEPGARLQQVSSVFCTAVQNVVQGKQPNQSRTWNLTHCR